MFKLVFKKGNKIQLGRHHTEETKEKIRQANSGERNYLYGKHLQDETKEKIRRARIGIKRLDNSSENNGLWKGDNVGYTGLHKWVRRYLPQPELCEICNERSSHDLANVTGIYNRDLNNWKYLCRGCHMRSDGRMNNLRHQNCEVLI